MTLVALLALLLTALALPAVGADAAPAKKQPKSAKAKKKQASKCRGLSKKRAKVVVRSRKTTRLRNGTRRVTTIYCDGSRRIQDTRTRTTRVVVDRPVPGPVVEVPGQTITLPGPRVEVPEPKQGFRLTLFHNNDGESKLRTGDSVADYGGAGRFANRLTALRGDARSYSDADLTAGKKEQGDILVSSGDNFLAGLALLTGVSNPGPWPDAIAASRLGYDAITLGNHEFDFGQSRLADYIEGVDSGAPFVSANLGFDNVTPRLKRLVDIGRIKRSVVVHRGGQRIGVIGLTTPDIAGISSPGNVDIDSDLAGAVNDEVDALEAQGVDKIVVSGHLQGRAADFALIPQVAGVDVWIAGGGDDLFASSDDTLIPGDTAVEPYPRSVNGADGKPVLVVSTSGEYKYVGRLTVEFDGAGVIKSVDQARSGPVRVSGKAGDPDVVPANPIFDAEVTDPIDAFTAAQAAQIVATQTADLRRQTSGTANDPIRRREASLGNLVADAFQFAGEQAKPGSTRMVAFSNGGGIRADLITGDANGADVSKADTFSVLPFFNQTGLVENVPCASLKSLLEHAYAPLPAIDGRFLQIAGMRVQIDPTGTAQAPNNDGSAPIATPGTRIREVDLVGPDGDYGTGDDIPVVDNGAVVGGCAPIDVVTTNFTAANGDFFPFTALGLTTFTSIGQLYNETLDNFLTGPLAGVISAADYPAVATPTRIVIAGD